MFNLYSTFPNPKVTLQLWKRKHTKILNNKQTEKHLNKEIPHVFLFCFLFCFRCSLTCRQLSLSQYSRWCVLRYWHCLAHTHYADFHHRRVSLVLRLSRRTGEITVLFHLHQDPVLLRQTCRNREGVCQTYFAMVLTTKDLSAWVLQG